MMLGWTLIVALAILAVWAVARGYRTKTEEPIRMPGDPSENILRERYARGEIDEETYRRKLEELRND